MVHAYVCRSYVGVLLDDVHKRPETRSHSEEAKQGRGPAKGLLHSSHFTTSLGWGKDLIQFREHVLLRRGKMLVG